MGYTSDTSDGRSFDWESYKWCNGTFKTLTKYCNDSNYGTVDNKAVLDPEDDAARASWGGDWRMPTYEEFKELLDNTTNEWITDGTVFGHRFTSKTNGNSIFLPAAGYRGGSDLFSQSADGFYWSSTVYPSGSSYARNLYFYSGNATSFSERYEGFSIRPVQ